MTSGFKLKFFVSIPEEKIEFFFVSRQRFSAVPNWIDSHIIHKVLKNKKHNLGTKQHWCLKLKQRWLHLECKASYKNVLLWDQSRQVIAFKLKLWGLDDEDWISPKYQSCLSIDGPQLRQIDRSKQYLTKFSSSKSHKQIFCKYRMLRFVLSIWRFEENLILVKRDAKIQNKAINTFVFCCYAVKWNEMKWKTIKNHVFQILNFKTFIFSALEYWKIRVPFMSVGFENNIINYFIFKKSSILLDFFPCSWRNLQKTCRSLMSYFQDSNIFMFKNYSLLIRLIFLNLNIVQLQ